ncbi:hypothetical protein L1987_59941 [Smallanthus sonchifolius]|uniref:Uncharacterized protein n=1 Tax=Smallanthus sonchifolius TaxID=185202 RepID=A0ACB9D6X2_9ASTR|nr:hypothetical protein L1987_59941 [Smallanthus sonchifolius]
MAATTSSNLLHARWRPPLLAPPPQAEYGAWQWHQRPESVKKRSSYQIETLTNLLLKQEQSGVIDAELTIVLSSISMACKQIASLVQRASISNLTGVQGAVNIQGEDQKKLDVISNEVRVFKLFEIKWKDRNHSVGGGGCAGGGGRELLRQLHCGVVFDPLDGSSNIDAAVSTGSIFGIYSPNEECLPDISADSALDSVEQKCIVNVCQPGNNLLAAGYCMYSSSIIFVLSIGTGVYAFTLDPMYGEFVLTQEKIQIPKSGKIYSFNEGNYQPWDDKIKKYMDDLKDPGPSGKPYSARYIGSLVGDFHGCFCTEGFTGTHETKRIHQRVPLYIGSVEEVEKLEKSSNQRGELRIDEDDDDDDDRVKGEEKKIKKSVVCRDPFLEEEKVKLESEIRAKFHQNLLRWWEHCGQAKIVVTCKNQQEMNKLLEAAKEIGLLTYAVANAGRTQALGMAPEAILCYQHALQSKSDYAMAFGNLASIYYERGNLEVATNHYKQAIARDTGFLEAYNNLDAGKVEEAIHCYRQCLSLQPSHPQALTNLGNIYMECNIQTTG